MPRTTNDFYNDLGRNFDIEDQTVLEEMLNAALEKDSIFKDARSGDVGRMFAHIDELAFNDDVPEPVIDKVIPDSADVGDMANLMAASKINSKYILEKETENIYIPKSDYCGIRAINKIFQWQNRGDDVVPIQGKYVSAHEMGVKKLLNHVARYIIKCSCPDIGSVDGFVLKKCTKECLNVKRQNMRIYAGNLGIEYMKSNCIFPPKMENGEIDNSDENNEFPHICKIMVSNGNIKVKNLFAKRAGVKNNHGYFNLDSKTIKTKYVIGLLKFEGSSIMHAVAIKNIRKITIEDLTVNISSRPELSIDVLPFRSAFHKIPKRIVFIWDCETHVHFDSKKMQTYVSAAFGLLLDVKRSCVLKQYCNKEENGRIYNYNTDDNPQEMAIKTYLQNIEFIEKMEAAGEDESKIFPYRLYERYVAPLNGIPMIFNDNMDLWGITSFGKTTTKRDDKTSIMEVFIDKIVQMCSRYLIPEIQCYAHNSSGFDSLFILAQKKYRFVNVIKNGNRIKKLTIDYNGVRIIFLDTLPFVTSSLKAACKTFGTEIVKETFDIVDKTREWYIINSSRERYEKMVGTPDMEKAYECDKEVDKRVKILYNDKYETEIKPYIGKYKNKVIKIMEERLKYKLEDEVKHELANDPGLGYFKHIDQYCNIAFKELYHINIKPYVHLRKAKEIDEMIAKLKSDIRKEITSGFKDWKRYLTYDVTSLTDLFLKVNKMYEYFGYSITNYVGLPAIAMDIQNNYCYMLRKVYVPKDPSLIKLCSDAYYGGIVVTFKREFVSKNGEYLISIDNNSEYPAAMTIFTYPTSKPKLIPKAKLESFDEVNKYPAYIITCDIEIPNIRYAFHLFRVNGALIFPSNKIMRNQTFNSVDIRNMLKSGYKVVKVHTGVYFKTVHRIFANVMQMLYDIRNEFKKLDEKDPERAKEYICKIISNSTYGKHGENTKCTTNYMDRKQLNAYVQKQLKKRDYSLFKMYKGDMPDDVLHKMAIICKIRYTKMSNDQYEVYRKFENAVIKRATYLAGFVTAYGRSIMCDLYRTIGAENLYASDTDSAYITTTTLNAKNIVLSNKLGGFKNDYGDKKRITYALFLDVKRYYLEFEEDVNTGEDDPITGVKNEGEMYKQKTFRFKFTGINFKDIKGCSSDVLAPDDREIGLSVCDVKDTNEYFKIMDVCRTIAQEFVKNFEKYLEDKRRYENNKDEMDKYLDDSYKKRLAEAEKKYMRDMELYNKRLGTPYEIKHPVKLIVRREDPYIQESVKFVMKRLEKHRIGAEVSVKDYNFTISCDRRAIWRNGEYYALGYDENAESVSPRQTRMGEVFDGYEKLPTTFFGLCNTSKKLFSQRPLFYKSKFKYEYLKERIQDNAMCGLENNPNEYITEYNRILESNEKQLFDSCGKTRRQIASEYVYEIGCRQAEMVKVDLTKLSKDELNKFKQDYNKLFAFTNTVMDKVVNHPGRDKTELKDEIAAATMGDVVFNYDKLLGTEYFIIFKDKFIMDKSKIKSQLVSFEDYNKKYVIVKKIPVYTNGVRNVKYYIPNRFNVGEEYKGSLANKYPLIMLSNKFCSIFGENTLKCEDAIKLLKYAQFSKYVHATPKVEDNKLENNIVEEIKNE